MPPRPTRLVPVVRDDPDPATIAEAASIIRAGGLVVFPTETVYGLGAHALDPRAVRSIFDAKGRPSTDPLIVHVRSLADLGMLVRATPPLATELARRFWPGPLTLVLHKRADVPAEVTAGLDTVAVRVPAHRVARALLDAAAVPIPAPSANLFSRPSPTLAAHVMADLDGRVDMVLDAGSTDVGLESTVLDLTVSPPRVLRPGGVSLESLRAVIPDVDFVSRFAEGGTAQVSPGQLLRHYAPRARMILVEGDAAAARQRIVEETRERAARGLRVGILAPGDDLGAFDTLRATGGVVLRGYGTRDDPERAARELFDAIRAIDAAGVDEILAVAPVASGIGLAITDRLVRAAEGRVIRAGDELRRQGPPPST